MGNGYLTRTSEGWRVLSARCQACYFLCFISHILSERRELEVKVLASNLDPTRFPSLRRAHPPASRVPFPQISLQIWHNKLTNFYFYVKYLPSSKDKQWIHCKNGLCAGCLLKSTPIKVHLTLSVVLSRRSGAISHP